MTVPTNPIEPREAAIDQGSVAEHTGFTGTRDGLTTPQVRALAGVMAALDGWWHHGDCIGGDAASHGLAQNLRLRIVGHPADVSRNLRAFCRGFRELHAPKPTLERNDDILAASSRLIACPRGMDEEQRSGTWSTIRKARALGMAVTIVWPTGAVTHEFPPTQGNNQ